MSSQPDRTDGYMFLGFLALCATTLGTIWLVTTDGWTVKGWSAVGAIGAAVQAIAVVIAAIYAARQLREVVRT